MADRINILAGNITRSILCLAWGTGFLLAGSARVPAAPPARTPYVPRAHVVEVNRSFAAPTTTSSPGAGVRAFQTPDAILGGTERFEIRWYANPPGIPPGVVLLLESIQERSATIKNHSLRINRKSEGHIRSEITIPAREVRQAGRVRQWRLRIVWRGRVLATQTSPNWTGTTRSR